MPRKDSGEAGRQFALVIGSTKWIGALSIPNKHKRSCLLANILATEDVVSSGNQYVYLPYHYNKEVQELGLSIVHYVRTKDNISDLMTKAVKVAEFKILVNALTGHDVTLINKLIAEAWEQIQDSM